MGRRAILVAVFVAALAWPAAAFAANGQLDANGNMVYDASGDGGEPNNVVFATAGDQFNPTYEVRDQPSVTIHPTPPCFNPSGVPDNVMDCPQDGGGQPAPVLFKASLGDGNDSITLQANLPTSIGAGGGDDTMNGGPAADFLRGGQGADTIDGGAGSDQLVGDDPNVAGGGNDTMNGAAGNDTMDGQDGDDVVEGGAGNDTLAGGGGNDTFPSEPTPDGSDTYSGGDGTDTVTFANRDAAVALSIDGVANDGQIPGSDDNIQTDVENLVGGPQGDQLSGSAAGNGLDGGGGDDTIQGLGGDDSLTGGGGNDNEDGGDGNDGESGGDGTDTLTGGAGDDTLAGDASGDSLDAGPGNDTLSGGADGDNLSGGDGTDSLDGGTGDDALNGGAGGDVMAGGDGEDNASYASRTAGVTVTLDGNAGDGEPFEGDNVEPDVEDLTGGTGADSFFGSPAPNKLDGGAGEDYEDGAAGADTLLGGDSGDVFRTRGSTDGDRVTCGPGPDFVVAKPADNVSADCDRVDRGVRQKPKLRSSAVVAPTKGTLQMSPTGIVRRVPLQDKVVLPLRSVVDTVLGAARVTSAQTTRKAQTVTLDHGAFDITQTRAKLAVTQFALQGGNFTTCPPAARTPGAAHSAQGGKSIRKLWASGKGQFRTKGRYASASIRGTRWLTDDRCDGTLIRVTAGVLSVRDLVAKKTVTVKAGHSYFAAARRR